MLSQVLKGAPWFASQGTQGIAVDAKNRVYVSDNANVYLVNGSSVSTYLTAAEAAGPSVMRPGFGDMDVGPDGQIYVLLSSVLFLGISIVRSSLPHQAQPWIDVSQVG